jgi:hypothetical protein
MKSARKPKRKPLRVFQRFGLALLGAGLIALGKWSLASVPAHYTNSHRHDLDAPIAILIGLVLIFAAFN